MESEPPFLVELLRRHPAGPLLYLIGFAALGVLWFNFEPGVPTSAVVKVAGLIGILALGIGMPLTHKHAFRLQAERQQRRVTRSESPWGTKS
jgi:hypothetical protein